MKLLSPIGSQANLIRRIINYSILRWLWLGHRRRRIYLSTSKIEKTEVHKAVIGTQPFYQTNPMCLRRLSSAKSVLILQPDLGFQLQSSICFWDQEHWDFVIEVRSLKLGGSRNRQLEAMALITDIDWIHLTLSSVS